MRVTAEHDGRSSRRRRLVHGTVSFDLLGEVPAWDQPATLGSIGVVLSGVRSGARDPLRSKSTPVEIPVLSDGVSLDHGRQRGGVSEKVNSKCCFHLTLGRERVAIPHIRWTHGRCARVALGGRADVGEMARERKGNRISHQEQDSEDESKKSSTHLWGEEEMF